MGCGVSKFDENEVKPSPANKLFHHKLEMIRLRRRHSKDQKGGNNPSTKALLEGKMIRDIEKFHVEGDDSGEVVDIHEIKRQLEKDKDDEEREDRVVKIIEALANEDDDDDVDGDSEDEDVGRSIGNHRHLEGHDGSLPGSPSFRVYVSSSLDEEEKTEAKHVDFEDAIPKDDTSSHKEAMPKKVVMKKERKRRSFKQVLQMKGGQTQTAVKNLLHIRSSSQSMNNSTQDRTHLLNA